MNKIQFGNLHPDGSVTDRRVIDQGDLLKCRFAICLPEHYREDGSCRCDDPEHRKMMIRDWEYKPREFRGIPLRKGKKL